MKKHSEHLPEPLMISSDISKQALTLIFRNILFLSFLSPSGIQLTNNSVIVSGGEQSGSNIHIYIYVCVFVCVCVCVYTHI